MITSEEQKRYHRQLLMLGEAGQERLEKAARVLIAGAGGLGTVIATYLAAAGIKRSGSRTATSWRRPT